MEEARAVEMEVEETAEVAKAEVVVVPCPVGMAVEMVARVAPAAAMAVAATVAAMEAAMAVVG